MEVSEQNLLPTLWHVQFTGRLTISPGQPYWFDNRGRTPSNSIVFQISFEGSILYQVKHQTIEVPPKHLLMFVYGESSSYGRKSSKHDNQPYDNMWLNLSGSGLLQHISLLRSRFSPVIDLSSDTSYIDQLINIYRMVSTTKPFSITTVSRLLHNYINDLFVLTESQRSSEQLPVDRAVDQIINQPTYPWSLKSLAASVGCSREHLTRHFTQRIGQPPASYLRSIRVKRAIQLLINSNLPIPQIAQNLGYTSVHTLARHIKETTGYSPQNYRNNN
ncbi:helix-turn-helix transcriptional regulator [Planctomycetota bacterium]|nr:helix-turn-helix transcriptional regulator [Planctomycetota bacterium]